MCLYYYEFWNGMDVIISQVLSNLSDVDQLLIVSDFNFLWLNGNILMMT